MSEKKDDSRCDNGGALPDEEEESLRNQVRHRLEAEYEREHAQEKKSQLDAASAELLRAERLRIVREEEDAFYAQRGLYRYRNHRGEYEWLSKEERDRRLAARREKHTSRRSEKGFLAKLASDKAIGDLINGLIVVAVLVIAIVVFQKDNGSNTKYVINVRSQPTGAAIFVNERAVSEVTDANVKIAAPGFYTIHVVKPGYSSRPPSKEVHVSDEDPAPVAAFTLYPETPKSSSAKSSAGNE